MSVAEVLLVAAPASSASRFAGAVIVAIPLVWCTRFPLAVAIATAAIVVVRAALDQYGETGISAIAASAVAAAAAGRFSPPRTAALAAGALVIAITLAAELQDGNLNDSLMLSLLVVLATVAAAAIKRHSEDLERSTREYANAWHDRETLVLEALDELRLGIARETHDSVGHALASLNMHAEAALLAFEKDPVAARRHLEATAESAHVTLDELDRLNVGLEGMLRQDIRDSRGVAEIAVLVRGSGLDAQANVACPPLSPRVSATAYMLVREALVNAAKHARGASVTIDIRERSGNLQVRVVNGRPVKESADVPGGHGLLGMRERAAALGGTLGAGPTPSGGWAVTAELPIEDAKGAPTLMPVEAAVEGHASSAR
jgi:signal transduction histidine kinase